LRRGGFESSGEIFSAAFRHAHAGQGIAEGVDIATISKRLDDVEASVILAIYAHMFTSDDRKAAAAIDAALKLSLRRYGSAGWQSGGIVHICFPK